MPIREIVFGDDDPEMADEETLQFIVTNKEMRLQFPNGTGCSIPVLRSVTPEKFLSTFVRQYPRVDIIVIDRRAA
jgi:hypothetical protein